MKLLWFFKVFAMYKFNFLVIIKNSIWHKTFKKNEDNYNEHHDVVVMLIEILHKEILLKKTCCVVYILTPNVGTSEFLNFFDFKFFPKWVKD